MSRIRNVIEIFDAFLSRRDKVNHDQTIGHEFDPICKTLFGVENGFEFISDFRALVAQLEEDVIRVPYLREEQRTHYFRQLAPLRTLFGSKTYLLPWSQLFQHLTEGNLRNSLLLMDPLLDSQQFNLRQMPDRPAIRIELDEYEKLIEQSALGADIKRLLVYEINKARAILQNEKSFKESRTWEQYQRLSAQLMAAAMDLDDEGRQKFRPAFQKMARRVRESLGLPPLPEKSGAPAAPAPAAVAPKTDPAPVATPPPPPAPSVAAPSSPPVTAPPPGPSSAADSSQKLPFVDWNEPV